MILYLQKSGGMRGGALGVQSTKIKGIIWDLRSTQGDTILK